MTHAVAGAVWSTAMKHSVPHSLPLDAARTVAKKAIEAYQTRFAEYHPTVRWVNDQVAEVSFSAKGVSLKGTFEILADRINLDMEVPLLLRMFKQKAVDVVEREIKNWLARAHDGEL
jgi:hypothetical protein